MRKTLSLGLAAAAGILAFPTAAQAQPQNVVCNGSLGAITVDNLEVLEFQRCTLTGTTVLGSISVKPGGRLVADGVIVNECNKQYMDASCLLLAAQYRGRLTENLQPYENFGAVETCLTKVTRPAPTLQRAGDL